MHSVSSINRCVVPSAFSYIEVRVIQTKKDPV